MRLIVRSRQMVMLGSLLAVIAFGNGARAEEQPAAKDEAAQPAAKDPAMPGCPGKDGECCGACQAAPAFKKEKGADAAAGCPCQRARQMQQGS